MNTAEIIFTAIMIMMPISMGIHSELELRKFVRDDSEGK